MKKASAAEAVLPRSLPLLSREEVRLRTSAANLIDV